MSKRTHRVVNLEDFKERKADEGAIDVVLKDGATFRIPPPELWPDSVSKRVADERRGGDAYPVEEMAADIAGREELQRFLAQGGTVTLFFALLKEEHNLDVGESSAS